MKEIVLEMRGIEKSFPGVKALNGANLTLYKGRVMGFLGENGAGKSTMMKVMTGIYSKDAGTIKYLGEERTFKNVKDSQNLGIAIIHQELNLIPQLTVMENIFLGREHSRGLGQINWKDMYEEAKKILEILGMEIDPKEKVENLSIGVQQMVEIAKVLSQNAKVIVMDEPTDALTDKETVYLFKVIKQLAAEGKSIVYISHRLKEIPEVCDDITIMRDGKFICEREVKDIDEDFIVKNMVGRSLDEQFPRVKVEPGKVVLKVNNLRGEKVKDVSFELRAGEILGISGLMGAGRTELAKTIYGYYKKQQGEIYIDGEKREITSPEEGLRAGIAYVSEDRKGDGLVLGMSVKENMTLSALKTLFTSLSIKKQVEASKVTEYIDKFNVKTPTMEQKIKNLSGGNQQKVAIAKALLTNPKVLILDEPTRGVDVGAKKEIYDVINELKTKGLSIIMISSEMPEVLGLSDRIMVMHENHVTGIMPVEEATQEKIMRCAVGVN